MRLRNRPERIECLGGVFIVDQSDWLPMMIATRFGVFTL
jgi:hypothetical protein